MVRIRRWAALVAATAFGVGALGLAVPGVALAQPVTSGSLTMSSDPGDPVGRGEQYAFSTAAGDQFIAHASADRNTVGVNVYGLTGQYWQLTFSARDYGVLVPGTYTSVARANFTQPGEAGLEVSGNSTGCNTITGQFTVEQLTWAADGLLDLFDVSFEQHCEGLEPALRGRLQVDAAPPEPLLQMGVTLAKKGTVSAAGATVSGTVTCTKPTSVQVTAVLTQQQPGGTVNGGGGVPGRCTPGTATRWQLTAQSYGDLAFQAGEVTVSIQADGWDLDAGVSVSANITGTVRLRR